MVTVAKAIHAALNFAEATEQPHFEKRSFRVRKKIFATLDTNTRRVVVKLSEVDQSVFCSWNSAVVYPVPGAWGKQGWTTVELKKVPMEMFRDILTTAYCQVAPATLARQYKS